MSLRCRSGSLAGLLCATLVVVAGCGDTRTVQREAPPGGDRMQGVRQVPLRPGQPAGSLVRAENPYAGDAEAVRDGRRLYHWMNCAGCHFEGGGGMGPALIDAKWIYGSDPAQIFDTIVNGRANGMPAYGDKLAVEEVWRIVAYVEELAAEAAKGGSSDSGQAAAEPGGNRPNDSGQEQARGGQ